MFSSLRQLVLYVLVAYLTVVTAGGVEEKADDDAVKHENSNTVAPQTPDLSGLSKLTARF